MSWLVQNTVYLTVTALLVILARRIMRGKTSARSICILWVLPLLRFFLPAFPSSKLSLFHHIPAADTPEILMEVIPLSSVSAELSAGKWLFFLWAAGVSILLLYFTVVYLSFRRGLSCLPDAEAIEETICTAKQALCLDTCIRVKTGGKTPMMAGLIHPVILLPDGYSKTEQYHILVHELCHYKYKDMIFLWISLVIAAFQWFNPVIWLSCFLFRRDLETLCDERALRVIEDRKAYCMLLLKTALRKNNFVAGTTGLQNGKKEVDVRIRRIAAWKRTSKGWMIFSVVLLITLGAVCLTNGQSQNFPMTPTAFQILPGELENSLKKAGYRLVNEETVRSWHYRLNGNVHYQDSETGVSYDAEKLAAKYGYDLKNYYGQTIAAYLYDVANEKEPLSSAKEIFLSVVAENGEVFTLKLASDSQKEYVAGKIDAFLAR